MDTASSLHFRAWGSMARGAPIPTYLLPQTPQYPWALGNSMIMVDLAVLG